MTIAANAGYDGSLVVGKLLEQDDCNFGFDAAKGERLVVVSLRRSQNAQTSSMSEFVFRGVQ